MTLTELILSESLLFAIGVYLAILWKVKKSGKGEI